MMKLLKRIWNYFFGRKEIPFDKVDEGLYEVPLPKEKEFEPTAVIEEKPIDPISIRNNLFPEKFEGETFEEYKKRRRIANEFLKRKAAGTLVFESKKAILDKTGHVKGFTEGKTFKGDTSKLKSI